jgi:hypothetical protein
MSTAVTVATASLASSPGSANGYKTLSSSGTSILIGLGDDDVTNYSVPPFVYAGQTYTSLGVGSNGCIVVGGGVDGVDCLFPNRSLPDPSGPNRLLAPFWTDLNPTAGGAVRIDVFTDVSGSWIVVEWDTVPEWQNITVTDQFEVWIGVNGVQDISFSYGTINGTGRDGNLTVGAQNECQGQNYRYNGTGTLPITGTELGVTSP